MHDFQSAMTYIWFVCNAKCMLLEDFSYTLEFQILVVSNFFKSFF